MGLSSGDRRSDVRGTCGRLGVECSGCWRKTDSDARRRSPRDARGDEYSAAAGLWIGMGHRSCRRGQDFRYAPPSSSRGSRLNHLPCRIRGHDDGSTTVAAFRMEGLSYSSGARRDSRICSNALAHYYPQIAASVYGLLPACGSPAKSNFNVT
jgi:hypothetical protein